MNEADRCPLAQVERRLDDAAKLWRKASESYFEPDEFRVHLQACIQAFRSVTWILQNHKGAIKDFDQWYSNWQLRMRQDSTLRWLVEARNKIEKQGDLDAKSVLRVTCSGSWFDSAPLEKELQPKLHPKEIQLKIVSSIPVEAITEEALLKIERRWIDSELPESEILDGLCHCYLTMRRLLHEAHEALANPVSGDHCSFYRRTAKTNEELPSFMLNSQQPRVLWVRMKDGVSVSLEQNVREIDSGKVEQARSHYGLDEARGTTLRTAKNFREACVAWFQYPKRMLEVDGYLIPTALVKTEKTMHLFQLRFDERIDKHIVLRDVADSCKRLDAVAIMLINEAWVAPAEFAKAGKHARECPDRSEAVVLHGLTKNGDAVDCMNVFTRVGGRVQFGEDKITEGIIPNIMAPFANIWKIKHTPT